MVITGTLTKRLLENLIQESFGKFGYIYSSALVDSLKFLGFSYATNSGISLSIEDLKTPNQKENLLQLAQNDLNETNKDWQTGNLSDAERFQRIIDNWNVISEQIKKKIIEYYQTYDPTNNIYLMSFSGARGNISQVRQVIGLRGLMSDQSGKIIDLPIQNNFREGLTSVDYIISSYGARKGIVDTALKTADAGYLTRRLIYLAQDLIIREIDCKTRIGIIIDFNSQRNFKTLIGKALISRRVQKTNQIYNFPLFLTESILTSFLKDETRYLVVRSPVTCESKSSPCQICYGWDLGKNKLINLGEAVGIIAAQSIGEPGTQLTMRTFHTGGTFTSQQIQQVLAPFSGKLLFPPELKLFPSRTPQGRKAWKLNQSINFLLLTPTGEKKKVFINKEYYFFLSTSEFVKKGQILAEASTSSKSYQKKLKPIYTFTQGEIRGKNLKFENFDSEITIALNDSVLWLATGKIFVLPKQNFYQFPKILQKTKSFSLLKLVSPYNGIFLQKDNFLTIKTKVKNKSISLSIDLEFLIRNIKNTLIKIIPVGKNYQYLDKYTIFAYLQIFSLIEEKIYLVRKRESRESTTIFLITESDIWKISSDQTNNYYISPSKIDLIKAGNFYNSTSQIFRSGFLLRKDGLQCTFQNAIGIKIPKGTLINSKHGDLVYQNQLIAKLINYTQQTEDIVQDLPKIEQLIEARSIKNKAILAERPGVYNKTFLEQIRFSIDPNTKIQYLCVIPTLSNLFNKRNSQRKITTIFSNFFENENCKFTYPFREVYQNLFHEGEFVDLGQPITSGSIDPRDLLIVLFQYHYCFDKRLKATLKSLNKFQLILLNSIQGIYFSQGVNIANKHIEMIARQLTDKVIIKENQPYLPYYFDELVPLQIMIEIENSLNTKQKRRLNYQPFFSSTTKNSLNKIGFLSSAAFQETRGVLRKAAIKGKKDYFLGLKECIISGKLIPAGTSFFSEKNNLDTTFNIKRKFQIKK